MSTVITPAIYPQETIFMDGCPIVTSVSKVLEKAGIRPPYPVEAERYVEAARILGKGIHERTERLDYQLEDAESVEVLRNSPLLGYISAYVDFLKEWRPQWQHIEQRFARDGCVGVPDRIGSMTSKTGVVIPVVVDIKSAKKIAPYWQVQLSAYKWISGFDGMLYVLWLKSSGKYQLLNYADAVPTWEGALRVAKWMIETGDGAVAKKRNQ